MKRQIKIILLALLLTSCGNTKELETQISNLEARNKELEQYEKLHNDNKDILENLDKQKKLTTDIAQKENTLKGLEEKISESTKKVDDIEKEKQRKLTEGVQVYEDDKVTINYIKTEATGVSFLVENKTNVTVTIQAPSIGINGLSYNQINMSDDVAPQSKGIVKAQVSLDGTDTSNVSTVSGTLRVIDFSRTFESYNVPFVNVEVQ